MTETIVIRLPGHQPTVEMFSNLELDFYGLHLLVVTCLTFQKKVIGRDVHRNSLRLQCITLHWEKVAGPTSWFVDTRTVILIEGRLKSDG